VGFAAPVLRSSFERLLDSYLRARDPGPERKAQQQKESQKQRERLRHCVNR